MNARNAIDFFVGLRVVMLAEASIWEMERVQFKRANVSKSNKQLTFFSVTGLKAILLIFDSFKA
jgi:hypothetical protein